MSTCKDTAACKALVALGNGEKLGVWEEDMGNVLDRQADRVSKAGRSYRLGFSNGKGEWGNGNEEAGQKERGMRGSQDRGLDH